MGNRRSRCMQRDKDRASYTGSIVPDQDPLTRSINGRVQRAEISRDYEVKPQVLGTGYSGAVRLAQSLTTKQQVAVKQFSKKRLKSHRLQLLQSEVEVYLRLDHPNICRLLHAYESKNDVWLVMELCGCELYSRLCERKVYREKDAADVMLQMLQAVSYLHSHNIVHRDLKLENWMYGATERDDRLKLIDFGFSRKLGYAEETLEMPCGTLHYTSPEVLSRKYTSKCDIWSLGVICYMLLVGRPPFRGPNNLKIAKAIIQEDFPRDGRWTSLSGDAQHFVTQMLQKDASRRPDAPTALQLTLVTVVATQSAFEGGDIGLDVLKSLQKFARGSHLRRAALTMMAYSLTSRELEDLEESFLALDRTGRGTITFDQLADVMHEHLEVSSEEVNRIFQCLDFAHDEEVRYTPFIAAMLATRVKLHEDKVRAAFENFICKDGDKKKLKDGDKFITANSLVQIFNGLCVPGKEGCKVGHGLTTAEAEQWIREVDYKGNGVIDYEEFLAALMGKKFLVLPSLDGEDAHPSVRVFESFEEYETDTERPRGLSDSFAESQLSTRIRHDLATALIDGDYDDRRASQSFQGLGSTNTAVRVRTVTCNVDESYFE